MHPTAGLRNALLFGLVGVALSVGPSAAARGTVVDQDPMEDMCAGDMQWMIGWCIDMIPSGQMTGVMELTAALTAGYSGGFEAIDVSGATGTRAFGINPQGDIVGSYTQAGMTHGFVLSDGVVTTIDYPGAATTEAWGINARGDIIGRYTGGGVPGVRGFLLVQGRFVDISIGNHLVTLPTKIGASGEIVGCIHDVSGLVDMYGYVQRGSAVTLFASPSTVAPNGSATMHNGIVPGGRTVVGLKFPAPGRSQAYVIRDGVVSYFDAPGSTVTSAWDVSARGTVVGQYDAGGRTHAFAYSDDGFVTLDVPGSTLTVARGVNSRGDIVGVYNDAAGAHGFVLRKY
jgi:probable HAF family extracellular repeat protein